jgi:pimeloyl-ACP methyl ester carboxylesterase
MQYMPKHTGAATIVGTAPVPASKLVDGAWADTTVAPGQAVSVSPLPNGYSRFVLEGEAEGTYRVATRHLNVNVGDLFPSTAERPLGYVEVGQPTGTFAGKPARGVMMVIHGGYFYGGTNLTVAHRPVATRWQARGFVTVNIDYRSGFAAFTDTYAYYDRIRDLVGSHKICTTGESAGGTLALMTASKRPDVACVAAMAAPTYIPSLPVWTNLTSALLSGSGGDRVAVSPATTVNASTIRARALLGYGELDLAIPLEQMDRMRWARPDFTYMRLLAFSWTEGGFGKSPFVHSHVLRSQFDRFLTAEVNLANAAVGTTACLGSNAPTCPA